MNCLRSAAKKIMKTRRRQRRNYNLQWARAKKLNWAALARAKPIFMVVVDCEKIEFNVTQVLRVSKSKSLLERIQSSQYEYDDGSKSG